MKKVLITGGTGVVGEAFIQTFYQQYRFTVVSRNESKQEKLKARFKSIQTCVANIEEKDKILELFCAIKPDIVIHAAAQKRIELGEKKPIDAVTSNIIGSLNVIEASRKANVPLTIGISSDKACLSNSVYGHTKHLMERIFLSASDARNKFACCRLGNVIGSAGSVIPLWLELAREDKALTVTSEKMNRFMFMRQDVAEMIQKSIDRLQKDSASFIITKNKKAINMLSLASSISLHITITGKRPGERLNEFLVSSQELPFTYLDDGFIFIKQEKNPIKKMRLQKSLNTLHAEKMNQNEIKALIAAVDET